MGGYGSKGGIGFWIFMIILVLLVLLFFYRESIVEYLRNVQSPFR